MRILLLYETLYPSSIGGAERRNFELAQALATRGHDVTLAGFGEGPETLPPGVRILSLGPVVRMYGSHGRRSPWSSMRFAWRTLARLDVAGYDLVEATSMFYMYLFPLRRLCRQRRVPLQVVWHEVWIEYWRGYVHPALAPLCELIERRAARVGDGVAASSELAGRRLASLRSADVPLLPCGIDVESVASVVAAAPPVSAPLVFAGRLIEHKRVELLIQAVAILAERRGGGKQCALLDVFGDGPARAGLRAAAAEAGVSDSVRFHDFLPDSEQLWQAWSGARLAVQPSAREGFGLFPLEALCCGLPVVYCASTESAVSELVRDGREGVETPSEPAALASALGALLDDEGRRATMSAAARRRAQDFDWSNVAVRFEELAEATIERRSGRRVGLPSGARERDQ